MILTAIIGLAFAAIAGAFTALARKWKFGPWLDQSQELTDFSQPMQYKPIQEVFPEPLHAPISPNTQSMPNPAPSAPQVPATAPTALLWDTPKHAYNSVGVLCDQAGLRLAQKSLIRACIFQESQFLNTAKNANPNSTDWGICQVNDRFHIGKNLDFPSVQYVLAHPDKVVEWMIRKYKAGQLGQWVSFSSGAYKKWLLPNSPMWLLAKP